MKMTRVWFACRFLLALLGLGLAVLAPAAQGGPPIVPLHTPLTRPQIDHSLLLGVVRAGSRIVAVGEGGTVALSDDDGATFRRAKTVPVQAALTSVAFADARRGWAVGHWGVILHTEDGGETWQLQREDAANDLPLYGVHFTDAQNGVAIGLWSLVLRTSDAGKTWVQVKMPLPPQAKKADRNLYSVFSDGAGTLYVTAEAGLVLKSRDGGQSWAYLPTGYQGSLWTGLALKDGTLLVAGLRGTLMRSEDGGATWRTLELAERSSITALAPDQNGGVIGAGLDGLRLSSRDGQHFEATRLQGRPMLTGLVAKVGAGILYISKRGPMPVL